MSYIAWIVILKWGISVSNDGKPEGKCIICNILFSSIWDKQSEREFSPHVGSFSKCLQQAGFDQAKARSQEIYPGPYPLPGKARELEFGSKTKRPGPELTSRHELQVCRSAVSQSPPRSWILDGAKKDVLRHSEVDLWLVIIIIVMSVNLELRMPWYCSNQPLTAESKVKRNSVKLDIGSVVFHTS